jgi:hypothetical protein
LIVPSDPLLMNVGRPFSELRTVVLLPIDQTPGVTNTSALPSIVVKGTETSNSDQIDVAPLLTAAPLMHLFCGLAHLTECEQTYWNS